MIKLDIIGTSGSKDNMKYFSLQKFQDMMQMIEQCVDDWSQIELWSGGSSGSDHVAVALALKHNVSLKLFLPAKFQDGKFYDNGEWSYRNNPGKQLNDCHTKFSLKININTLAQLSQFKGKVYEGFHARNRKIAKADGVIAFGIGPNISGGTKYTWDCAQTSNKIYFDITQ